MQRFDLMLRLTARPTSIVVAAVALAVVPLGAQAPQTFNACYVPTVGAIYLVGLTGVPSACLAASHVAVSWTQGGTPADGSVTAVKLADGAVVTIKLADGSVTSAKLAFDPATQVELDATVGALQTPGTINAGSNPVDWTRLKNVPAGLADGVDNESAGTATDLACAGCVGTADLADGAVTSAQITSGQLAISGKLTHANNDGFVSSGTFGSGAIPATGTGSRLMFYPRKGAFRAGLQTIPSWEDADIGDYSAAVGGNTLASGTGSFASGAATRASGDYSAALGNFSTASGLYSFAAGSSTDAGGNSSVAVGGNTTASGVTSFASGFFSTASGGSSTAVGQNTTASGNFTFAAGFGTTAAGAYSVTLGDGTIASGLASTAMGFVTTAQPYASLVIGRYNVVAGSPTTWVATEPLLVAGNGTSTAAPSNALTLLKNGNLTIAGSLTQASDVRLKEELDPVTGILARVLALTPVRYRFREGTGHPREPKLGLSAQAVEPLFPELVSRGADGYLSLAYGELSAVLVGAIQEQQRDFETLRAAYAALYARLAALEAALGGATLTAARQE